MRLLSALRSIDHAGHADAGVRRSAGAPIRADLVEDRQDAAVSRSRRTPVQLVFVVPVGIFRFDAGTFNPTRNVSSGLRRPAAISRSYAARASRPSSASTSGSKGF